MARRAPSRRDLDLDPTAETIDRRLKRTVWAVASNQAKTLALPNNLRRIHLVIVAASMASATADPCAICLGEISRGQAVFVAECSHTFHHRCISDSVAHGNRDCPLCKATWRDVPAVEQPVPAPVVPPPRAYAYDEVTVAERAVQAEDGGAAGSAADAGELALKTHCEFSAIARDASRDSFAVLVQATAPEADADAAARAPLDLVTVLDVSASMEQLGKLALLKRAMGFVIDNLGPADRLSVVSFSNDASRKIRLTRMSGDGKASAKRAVESLVADGMTNIREGLRVAARVLDDRRYRNAVTSVILLSDGQDNRSGVGVRVREVKSGRYENLVAEDGLSASVNVGELYAGEERRFLVFLDVPRAEAAEEATQLIKIGCTYRDTATGRAADVAGEDAVVQRPVEVTDPEASKEVERERVRVAAAEDIAAARAAAERGEHAEAGRILQRRRQAVQQSTRCWRSWRTSAPARRTGASAKFLGRLLLYIRAVGAHLLNAATCKQTRSPIDRLGHLLPWPPPTRAPSASARSAAARPSSWPSAPTPSTTAASPTAIAHGNRDCPLCKATWRDVPAVEQPAPAPAMPPPRAYADDDPVAQAAVQAQADGQAPEVGEMALKTHCEFPAVARVASRDNLAVLVHARAPEAPRALLDLVTVLDVSGSMTGNKLALLKQAMRFVIGNLGPADRLSVVAFSAGASRKIRLTRMSDDGKASAKHAVESLVAGGSTNIGSGLQVASEILADRRYRNAVTSVILLSDGQDTCIPHRDFTELEERRFLLFVDVPMAEAAEDATQLVRVRCTYRDVATGRAADVVGDDAVVQRPAEVTDPEVSVEVERERVRVAAAEEIAAARAAAERGAFEEAGRILHSQLYRVQASLEAAPGGDPMLEALEDELEELEECCDDENEYERVGRARVLKDMSSHAQQRASYVAVRKRSAVIVKLFSAKQFESNLQ
ncbi:hypothetical protein C2845_PM01G40500 [Panicum miliaceum]|uniref:Uncharacterized protein n=1 Tax=Panicum miliaceum TaxID=4540 RepID=A0A3L6TMW3_PANMI|nr:hypothetical protein C2845_PM01G40500 [Panicum miliaceum]